MLRSIKKSLEAVQIQTFIHILLSIDTSYPNQTLQLYLVGSQGFNVTEGSVIGSIMILISGLIFGF